MDKLVISDIEVPAGEKTCMDIVLPRIFGQVSVSIPVMIYRSQKQGPRLFVTGGIHGDEIIGIDIISQLIKSGKLEELVKGDVVIIPVVNMYGFIQQKRYMPDRRDLNRSFPGSERGSLGSVLANFLCTEVIEKCTHGIDLHSGASNHANLPQVRIDMQNPESIKLAEVFAPKLIVRSKQIEGSLRQFCREKEIPSLLFEGSEANRFSGEATRTGCNGILNVMSHLGMIERPAQATAANKTEISHDSYWERASEGGIFRTQCNIGQRVKQGDVIGDISDLFGNKITDVKASKAGLVCGITRIPTVNRGDALYHIAMLD